MRDIDLQDAFNRVYLYLLESGVEMTEDQCCTLLQMVEKAVRTSSGEATVRDCVVDLLPEYFTLPELAVPEICPPLKRGSIGYDPPGVNHGEG